MNIKRILPGIIIIVIINSCAVKKYTEEGNDAYQAGDYDAALESLEQVIEKRESNNKKAEAEIYYKAGLSAKELDQTSKARRYLESAENLEFTSPELFASLADIYKTIDNLSKEINVLEDYHEKYPEGDKIDAITVRLFETYVESENWELAVDLWSDLGDEAQDDIDLLTGYLIVNKNLENEARSKELAEKILKLDSDNITALEWLAEKYFWDAEDLYIEEMEAYEENRNWSQYRKLKKALDKAYADFEKSRDYFLKLYELDPKPEYAKFLGRAYTRLQEEDKAEYYYQKAEE
ncbi:MAG: hypothetical protein R6U04_00810 [Bacteroidales bacterium]